MARRPVYRDGTRSKSAPDRMESSSPSLVQQKQDAFDRDLDNRKSKKERTAFTSTKLNARIKQAEAMRESGDWDKASAQHFVALYVILHEAVYGIRPLEFTDDERAKAAMMASRMLKTHFEDSPSQMATFMRDVWNKERATEKWRRENHREGSRIGWYRQFNGSLVTDWRINQLRKGNSA